jgi:hypothetical protein
MKGTWIANIRRHMKHPPWVTYDIRPPGYFVPLLFSRSKHSGTHWQNLGLKVREKDILQMGRHISVDLHQHNQPCRNVIPSPRLLLKPHLRHPTISYTNHVKKYPLRGTENVSKRSSKNKTNSNITGTQGCYLSKLAKNGNPTKQEGKAYETYRPRTL